MRFTTFILGALAAPQLTNARPPLHQPSYHQFSQDTAQAVLHYPPAHATANLHPPSKLDKKDLRPAKFALTCTKHGAQCVQFPPGAPSNETIWVRIYCHKVKHHHRHRHRKHHHHHHNKQPNDNEGKNNSTEFRPLIMYPCPMGTQCRVNALPPGYSNPPWLDNADPDPDPDPVSDLDGTGFDDGEDEEGGSSWINLDKLIRQAADGVATVLDTFPGDGLEEDVQKYVHKLPWWSVAFTCVHKDDDDQYRIEHMSDGWFQSE
ncbi:hypothetical protein F5B21DRAFT_484676 [Xylaria acuta]|nr:hypothetical protein F5B21DRAFT_484676 [Xylaria acuta]